MLVLAAALALVTDSPALSDEHYNWTDKMMYTTDQVCPWQGSDVARGYRIEQNQIGLDIIRMLWLEMAGPTYQGVIRFSNGKTQQGTPDREYCMKIFVRNPELACAHLGSCLEMHYEMHRPRQTQLH